MFTLPTGLLLFYLNLISPFLFCFQVEDLRSQLRTANINFADLKKLYNDVLRENSNLKKNVLLLKKKLDDKPEPEYEKKIVCTY